MGCLALCKWADTQPLRGRRRTDTRMGRRRWFAYTVWRRKDSSLECLVILHLIRMPQMALEAKRQLGQARPAGAAQPLGGPQPGAARLPVVLLVAPVGVQPVDGAEPRLLDPPVVLVAGGVQLLRGPQMPGAELRPPEGPRTPGEARRLEGQLVLQDLVREAEMRVATGEAVVVMNGDRLLIALLHRSRHPRQALARSRRRLLEHRCPPLPLGRSLLRRRPRLVQLTGAHLPLVCSA
ncbi:hypothetical protein BDV93DRAFT_302718 [Ceratobasidium sp. AG-I]|nr:hypothetical protein BDV93DRAFT_302718 [Ceratobasidium sp. AG-I]